MFVTIDHDAAARHGISSRDIDNALYNAFCQRTASTIYEELNQYSVILGVAPRYAQSSDALNDVYVPARLATTEGTSSSTGSANPALRDPSTGSVLSTSVSPMVPLSAIARFAERATPTSIRDRKSDVEGKSVSVRLDTGGGRIIK